MTARMAYLLAYADHECSSECSAANGWTICEHPERPPDGHAQVHLVKCWPCRVGAEANARQWPERWKLIYEVQTLYWEQS